MTYVSMLFSLGQGLKLQVFRLIFCGNGTENDLK